MAPGSTIETIQKQAAAAPYEDGLLELFATVLFLGVAMLWGADNGYLMSLVAIPVIIGGGAALLWAKKRITFPRTGYVEPKKPADTSPWGGIIFILVGIGLMVGAIAVTGEITDAADWRRWAPFLAGFLSSAGFWYAAEQSGMLRYRLIALFSVVVGLWVSLVTDGVSYQPVSYYALAMAGLLGVLGVVTLIRFMRTHPIQAEDPTIG